MRLKIFLIRFICFTTGLVVSHSNTFGQVSISGPTCVIAGQQYSYNFNGAYSGTTDTWGITGPGGTILQAYGTNVTGTSTSKTGTSVGFIVVQWTSAGSGSITLSSSIGNAPSLLITIVNPINGGSITTNATQTIPYNTAPATINCSVATNGYCSPAFSYQWQKSTDGSSWTNMSQTTQNLAVTDLLITTTYYRRMATETHTSAVAYSGTATVFVNPPFSSTTISPSAQNIFSDNSAATISGPAATGGSCGGSYVYLWQKSTDGGNTWSSAAGTNNLTSYNPTATTGLYRRKDMCGSAIAYSNVVSVTVFQHVTGGVITPSLKTITYNTDPGIISITNPTGGMCAPSYSYTWYASTDNSTWSVVATTQDYDPGKLTTPTHYYKRKVSCSGENIYSNTIQINVNPQIFPGTIYPSTIGIQSGSSPGTLYASPATGGACGGNFTYQWYSSTDGTTFSLISGATALSYAPGNLTATKYYKRQVSCSGDILTTNTVVVSVNTNAVLYNYVQVRTITKPAVTAESAAAALSAPKDVQEVTQYFDGLGRPLQTVARQETPAGKDLVALNVYDEYNREVLKYLPYVSSANDGNFRPNALTEQYNFNSSQFAGEQNFFARTDYEPSPLGIVKATYAPGSAWTGSDRGTAIKHWSNTATDDVKIWVVSDVANSFGTYTMSGSYPAGSLLKTVTIDENGKQVIEFKDLQGRIVLKKVQATGSDDNGNGTGYPGWLCTYYIYDVYGNLRCVVQPNGVDLLRNNSWNMSSLSGAILNEQCFRYEYDQRNRMILKKVPAAAVVYMVYDKRDRLIYSQDGNMRSKNWWSATLYDNLNRQVQTGMMTYSGDRSALQTYVDGLSPNNSSVSSAGTGISSVDDNLFVNQRELQRASYQATNSVEFGTGFASEDNASFTAEIISAAAPSYSGSQSTYMIAAPPGSSFVPLTMTFYDDYSFTSKGYSTTNNSKLDIGTNGYGDALPSSASKMCRGAATGSRVRVIENAADLTQGAWMETVNFYDDKGRTVQTQADNYKGGKDITTIRYNFTGIAITSYLVHNNASAGISNMATKTNMNYDARGRLLNIQKSINDGTAKTIAVNTYNELGQLKTKSLGTDPADSPNPLETLTYEYNIRGWLLGINRGFAKSTSSAYTNYFGFDLGYDKTSLTGGSITGSYANAQYNGNIAGMVWRSAGDGEVRKYDFSYDNVNRLTAGDFNQYTSGSFNKTAKVDFSVSGLAYDANGNIASQKQMGLKPGGSSLIDNLSYTYIPNSNQLKNVIDNSSDAQTVLGDFHYSAPYTSALGSGKTASATDYIYDVNGNLTQDKNKDITSITYNYLNLPAVITVTAKGTITYIYDALGNKLEKRTVDNTTSPLLPTTTTYLGGFVYQNNLLQYFGHEEGRIRKAADGVNFIYDYFLKDHLGNVRMVLTEEQKTDAYPTLDFEGSANTSAVTNQDAVWSNSSGGAVDVVGTRTARPSNMGTNTTNGSYAKLITKSSAGGAIGAAMLLKVMSGDQINAAVDYYWPSATVNNTHADGIGTLITSLASALMSSPDVSAAIKGSVSTVNSALTVDPNVVSQITSPENSTSTSSQPKAYLHVLFFNEQFIFDNVNSVVQQIGTTSNAVATISKVLTAKKNGYVYVYFSNESDNSVYFDNFKLTHVRGPELEETHYYPFGLSMSGISSKALSFGNPSNKFKYNGKEEQRQEFSDGSGLEWTDYGARMYDAQIGRWGVIDPLTDISRRWSPYSYGYDNSVCLVDIDGMAVDKPDLPKPIPDDMLISDPNAREHWQEMEDKRRQEEKEDRRRNDDLNYIAGDASGGDGGFWDQLTKSLKAKFKFGSKGRNQEEVDQASLDESFADQVQALFKSITRASGDAYITGISLLPFGELLKGGEAIVVLGKNRAYLDMAKAIGAKVFNVSDKLSPSEVWTANKAFIDKYIAKGYRFLLSHTVKDISVETGAFGDELRYLGSKGFKLNSTGTEMIK